MSLADRQQIEALLNGMGRGAIWRGGAGAVQMGLGIEVIATSARAEICEAYV
jgi:hypothetical protein